MTRPHRLVVVTGTGTEVGKTWIAAALARELRNRGLTVAARKPVQSFAPDDARTDADVLAAATGEEPHAVCPSDRRYEVAMAPPMAAEVLARSPFTIAQLAEEVTWPDGIDIGLVEGAGGPRSPLASDGDTVDLATALEPDAVVLVAEAGLGTIGSVRLAHAPLAEIAPVVVVLNRYDGADDLHTRNREWLSARAGFDVVVSVDDLARRVLRTEP